MKSGTIRSHTPDKIAVEVVQKVRPLGGKYKVSIAQGVANKMTVAEKINVSLVQANAT